MEHCAAVPQSCRPAHIRSPMVVRPVKPGKVSAGHAPAHMARVRRPNSGGCTGDQVRYRDGHCGAAAPPCGVHDECADTDKRQQTQNSLVRAGQVRLSSGSMQSPHHQVRTPGRTRLPNGAVSNIRGRMHFGQPRMRTGFCVVPVWKQTCGTAGYKRLPSGACVQNSDPDGQDWQGDMCGLATPVCHVSRKKDMRSARKRKGGARRIRNGVASRRKRNRNADVGRNSSARSQPPEQQRLQQQAKLRRVQHATRTAALARAAAVARATQPKPETVCANRGQPIAAAASCAAPIAPSRRQTLLQLSCRSSPSKRSACVSSSNALLEQQTCKAQESRASKQVEQERLRQQSRCKQPSRIGCARTS